MGKYSEPYTKEYYNTIVPNLPLEEKRSTKKRTSERVFHGRFVKYNKQRKFNITVYSVLALLI